MASAYNVCSLRLTDCVILCMHTYFLSCYGLYMRGTQRPHLLFPLYPPPTFLFLATSDFLVSGYGPTVPCVEGKERKRVWSREDVYISLPKATFPCSYARLCLYFCFYQNWIIERESSSMHPPLFHVYLCLSYTNRLFIKFSLYAHDRQKVQDVSPGHHFTSRSHLYFILSLFSS